MSGIEVSVCRACDWRGFPARLWCPACGGGDLGSERVASGTVEERTTVRKAAGRELAGPLDVATVALAGGGRAVVRLEAASRTVVVDDDDGAPVAREAG